METTGPKFLLDPPSAVSKLNLKQLNLKHRTIRVFTIDQELSSLGHISGTISQIPLLNPDGDSESVKRKSFFPWHKKPATTWIPPPQTYDALSYNWGPQTTKRQVLMDGNYLDVSENLWQFLNVWRSSQYAEHRIFIDQICVDQANEQERNHQVSIMGEVFRGAATVHVWLGQATTGSDAAMQLMRRIPCRLADEEPLLPSLDQDELTYLDTARKELKQPLEALFTRPYWSRLWIVQEILGASDQILVHCGTETVTVRQFTLLIYVGVSEVPFRGRREPKFALNLLSFCAREAEFRTEICGWNELAIYFRQECTNILDRVYGLQGLLPYELRVAVDYSISADELFFRLVSKLCFPHAYSLAPSFNIAERIRGTEEAWSSITMLIGAFMDALELRIPPGVVKRLIWTEMRIQGVMILDKVIEGSLPWSSEKTRFRRQPKDYVEFRGTFDSLCKRVMDPMVETAPAYTWIPPPSYHAIRRSQKLRYIRALNSKSKMKIWYGEHFKRS